MNDSPEEIAGDPNTEVTPAQATIIKQTVEAFLCACVRHRTSESGESRADVSRASDAGRASDTSERVRGVCFEWELMATGIHRLMGGGVAVSANRADDPRRELAPVVLT